MSDSTRAVSILENLIGFPSISRESNSDVTDYVERQVRSSRADEVERLEYRDARGERKACLVARWGSEGPGGLAYFGHTDVVPADGWQGPGRDPFHAVLERGRIYGRGACDMKGSLAMALAAIDQRAERMLARPLYLTFTADEEIGYDGVKCVVRESSIYRQMCEGQPKGIVGEPTRLEVVHAHKGTLLWRVTSRGRAAHSSTGRGLNANMAMIPFLAQLKAIHDELETLPQWRDPRFEPSTVTMNIGINDHTPAINITPPQCVCTVYLRPSPDMNVEPLEQRVRRLAVESGLEFNVQRFGAPLWTEPHSEFVREMLEIVGAKSPQTVCYGTDGGELGRLQELVVWGPGDIAQAHTSDEWIELTQLERGVELFSRMIDRWCQPA